MSYMALYRKWRPDTFEEVKGQDHIVTTLKNQIVNNRIGHAFLFCGTRGTGKTSIAKLFAKAVNCEAPVDGSPCNCCASCKAIATGSAMNVVEIDAASNNGVDNIRQIRDEVQYTPTTGKYLVYIIDEVHMLTQGAFNALLKTLEEPPSYVMFILATTESHKIPITISSRCQKYEFRRISVETISARLAELMRREDAKAENKALDYIAKAADGSMRDALSILDQCIAFNIGKELTYDSVLDTIGAVDVDVFARLLAKVVTNDTVGAIDIIDEVVWQGRELSRFVSEFTWFLRNVMLIKVSEDTSNIDMSAENIARIKDISSHIDIDILIRYINVFSETSANIKYANQKRVVLEIAIIRLCKPEMDTDYSSVLDRVRVLENTLEDMKANGIQVANVQANASAQAYAAPEAEQIPEITGDELAEKLKKEMPEAEYEELMSFIKSWKESLSSKKGVSAGYLQNAKINLNEDASGLLVSFVDTAENAQAIKYYKRQDHMDALQEEIEGIMGRRTSLALRVAKSGTEAARDVVNNDLQKINFAVSYE